MKADVGSDVVDDAAATVPLATVPVVLFRTATVLAESDTVSSAGGVFDQPALQPQLKELMAVKVAVPVVVAGVFISPPHVRVQAPLGHDIVDRTLRAPLKINIGRAGVPAQVNGLLIVVVLLPGRAILQPEPMIRCPKVLAPVI